MTIALDRLRQDVQADIEKANPQYDNALNALRMLNKADYDEIRTFRQPPQPVLAVMNTICIMFQRKPEYLLLGIFQLCLIYLFLDGQKLKF
jgi:hypothetical protein